MKLAAWSVLALLFAVAGCKRSFTSQGSIASQGSGINTWHAQFQGCTRAPFDALPAGQTRSILTFIWQDPGIRDPAMDHHLLDHPDFPMRLEFSRSDRGTVATLHTLRSAGILLDRTVCSTFDLQTQEQALATPGSRASLSGALALECGVKQGHITANLHFENCKY